MQAQMKTLHFWLSWVQLVVGVVAGSQGLLGPKAMQWFIIVNAILNKGIQMMAAKWQPSPNAAGDIEPPKALLPLLFAGALLINGCAFGRCELGKLGSIGQVGFATAQKIASEPSSTSQDLVNAALQLAPGQLECGAQALLDWLDKSAGRKAGLAFGAAPDHTRAVLREYLAGKKLACAPRVAALEPCADGSACREITTDDDVPTWNR